MDYTIDFSEYFTFDELTAHLHEMTNRSEMASLQSLGQSHR